MIERMKQEWSQNLSFLWLLNISSKIMCASTVSSPLKVTACLAFDL